jgi:ribosome-binding protein aMBF1 (putative translation factor)
MRRGAFQSVGRRRRPRYRKLELVKVIGSRVAEARKARGWTQAALAEAIGIESVSLSRLETGQRALLHLAKELASGR